MSATPSLFAGIGFQFFSNNGVPLAGGKVFSYLAGTTTPVATYTDKDGIQAHPNPIILDSAGRVPSGGEIWLREGDTTDYKFVLKDANDVLIATYDFVPGTYSAGDLADTSNPALGDALVGFRQSNSSGNLTGAVGRTVHQKLQEFISVKDFGAVGDGMTDDTVAVHAFFDALADNGGVGYINEGTYLCDPYVRDFNTKVSVGFTVYGAGPTSSTLKLKTLANFLQWSNASNVHINGITVDCGYSTLPATGVLAHGIIFYNCNDCSANNCHAIDFSKTGFIGYTDSTTSGTIYNRVFFRNCYANAAAAKAASLDTNGVLISDYWYSGIENCIAEDIYTYGIELKQDSHYCHVIGCTAKNVASAGFAMGQTTVGINSCDFNTVTDFIAIDCRIGGVIGEGENNLVNGFLVDWTNTLTANQNSAFRLENCKYNTILNLSAYNAGAYVALFTDDAGAGVNSGNFVHISNITKAQATYYAAGFAADSAQNSVIVDNITDSTGAIVSGSAVPIVSGGTNNKFFYQQYPTYRLGSSGASNNSNAKMILESNSNTIFNFLAPLAPVSGLTFSNPDNSTDGYFHYNNTNKRYDLVMNAGSMGYRFQTNQFVPLVDNTAGLGAGSARWSVVYAANGTINTSDNNEKQQIRPLNEKEQAVAKRLKTLIRAFKFNDAVKKKGDDARIHVGVIAQDVKAAFESESLVAENYGVFCSDTWTNDDGIEQTRLGVRYDELFAFVIGAL